MNPLEPFAEEGPKSKQRPAGGGSGGQQTKAKAPVPRKLDPLAPPPANSIEPKWYHYARAIRPMPTNFGKPVKEVINKAISVCDNEAAKVHA